MKYFLALALTSFMTTSAFATIDSYVNVKIPVHGMHESGVCLIDTLAWDGISSIGTAQSLAGSALNGPLKIPAFQAGEDAEGLVQVNMLYQSGVTVGIEVDMDNFDKATIKVDATKATATAKTLEERQEVIKNVKIAIYAGVHNTVDGMVKVAKVELKGLPDQKGIKNVVPTAFKANFTKASPYLATVKKELNIVDGAKNCR